MMELEPEFHAAAKGGKKKIFSKFNYWLQIGARGNELTGWRDFRGAVPEEFIYTYYANGANNVKTCSCDD